MGIFPSEVLSTMLAIVIFLAVGIITYKWMRKRSREQEQYSMRHTPGQSKANAQSRDSKLENVALTSDIIYIADTISSADKCSHNNDNHTGSNSNRSHSHNNHNSHNSHNHDSSHDSGSFGGSGDGGGSSFFD